MHTMKAEATCKYCGGGIWLRYDDILPVSWRHTDNP
jgi:hypothetical protein